MRHSWKVILTIGIVALMASPVLAQRQRPGFPGGTGFGGRGGGTSGTALLRNEGVQQELKMTESQVNKLEEVEQTIREKMREETNKALANVLDSNQLKRYKQIELQQQARSRGLEIFLDPTISASLKLNDEQKSKIKSINADLDKDLQALRGDGGRGFNRESFEKMAALRTEAMENASQVLTEEQKTSWKNMMGEPFEIRFGGGPGGPGGNRPERPGGDNRPPRRPGGDRPPRIDT